jgi:serine/threonine protein kinase/tetratricopeptide (TPR) repeat protein
MDEESLFHLALAVPAAERGAFLEQACGGDDALRRRVEALVRAHETPGSFLRRPPLDPETTAPGGPGPAAAESPGARIGPYKLLQLIGEGGMGAVWMAEQQEPVRRAVALKLIRPGMDSRQVVARFEAERQALALMDHPNIAKVLDAGATDSGRPYFVMELVKGVPITDYCDRERLTPRERLGLLTPVCQAVQHAHQKGVIHRDLKPSNVLVACYDGRPVPKVIDFGVAKATGPRLTERTLFTQLGAVVGTLEYMSPEQAVLNQLDVDTRSDVYALGVLLYELLTGTTPLERQRVRRGDFLELLRAIREEEPPRPSTRLTGSGETLPEVAARRGMEPVKLARLVRGELDWIALKALEKDRNRRYESAGALARDLERFLADEPVHACPPSAGYRLRKFTRRHRRALVTAAVIALVVLAAVAAVAGAVGWAARDRAVRQATLGNEVLAALDEAAAALSRGQVPTARAALRRAEGLLAGGGDEGLGPRVRRWRTDLDFVGLLEELRLGQPAVRGEQFDAPAADRAYREAFRGYGLDVEALEPEEAARRVRASAVRGWLAAGLDDWVFLRWNRRFPGWERLLDVARRADPDPWRDRLRDAFQRQDPKALEALARDPNATAQPTDSLLLLVWGLCRDGGGAQAAGVLRPAQRQHPDDFLINYMLAYSLLAQKKSALTGEAAGFLRAALVARPDSPAVHVKLGLALLDQGQPAEGEAEFRAALRLQPESALAQYDLALALSQQGRHPEAAATIRAAARRRPDSPLAHYNLGIVLRQEGKVAEAEAEYRQATRLEPSFAPAHNNLAALLSDERHDYAGAAAEFGEAARLDPTNPVIRLNHGNLLRVLGRTAEAEAEFREAVRLQPDSAEVRASLGQALRLQGKLPEAEAALSEAARQRPNSARIHSALGATYARLGQWGKAAAAFQRAVELSPNDRMEWCAAAALRLRGGDVAGYRQACRELVKRFGRTDDPEAAAFIARACTLAPDALGTPGPVLALADRAVSGTANHRDYRFFLLVRGLTDLRAGRPADAIGWLGRAVPRPHGERGDATAFAALALAHHHLGRPEEAGAALANAKAILAAKMPDPEKGRPLDEDWIGWLHCQLLTREAEELLAPAGTDRRPG